DRLLAVGRLGHDVEILLAVEHESEPGADHRLIVGDHYPDHGAASMGSRARTAKPPSGRAPASNVPPNSATRSCIPISPWPLPLTGAAGRAPSSVISRSSRRPLCSTRTCARPAPACLSTLVSASC